MIDLFRFEWVKLSRRWMLRIIILLVLLLIVLAFWGTGTRAQGRGDLLPPRGWLSALLFCSVFAPFFWPVLGGSWAGNEYGWGTIRTVLTRRPNRIQYVLSALAALMIALLVALLLVLVVATIAGGVVAAATGSSVFAGSLLTSTLLGALLKGLLASWYISGFYLLVAYTTATIFRSPAVGIGVGIGSTLAEFIVQGIFARLGGIWNDIAQHFPVVYTQDLVTRIVSPGLIRGSDLASVSSDAPSVGRSLLAITIYTVILLVVTLVVVQRRDVTD